MAYVVCVASNMDMDLYEDGRCAKHATFNISAAGMDSMCMLMMQVSTCIRSLAALVLRYTAFGTARRAGQHRIDVDHAICSMRCRGVLRHPSSILIVFWRLATKICPLRASLAVSSHFA